MLRNIIFTLALLISSVSFANQNINEDHYLIDSVEIVQVDEVEIPFYAPAPLVQTTMDLGKVIAVTDKLIALGQKVWPIIQAGKPVYNTSLVSGISVLPKSDLSPLATLNEMSNWSAPNSAHFKIIYRNKLGFEVIKFSFNLYYQYGGRFDGKGKYLTSITTDASHVSADWGFNLDAKSELVSITNVGTAKNPVAAAIIKVSLRAKGVINNVENSYSYYVDGNGNFKDLNLH